MFELESFLHELQELHPELVTLKNLGHSGAGREMFAVTISKPEDETERKKDKKRKKKKGRKGLKPHDEGQKFGFVVVGAQHAREVRVCDILDLIIC